MPADLLLLAACVFGFEFQAGTLAPRSAPSYSGNSIVNAADFQPASFAPNTLATILGTNLAYTTKALSSDEMQGGTIPSVLPGTGVRVLVGNTPAGIYYVSPTQINFLIPSILIPGPTTMQLTIDGLAGPAVKVQLTRAAPAFFLLDPQNVVASRPDFSVITPDNPARPGDVVILWVNGLGPVDPPLNNLEVAATASWIQDLADLRILFDGVAMDPSLVLYGGVAPGFAGLYQINLILPMTVGANPEIRVAVAGQTSPTGILLPVKP